MNFRVLSASLAQIMELCVCVCVLWVCVCVVSVCVCCECVCVCVFVCMLCVCCVCVCVCVLWVCVCVCCVCVVCVCVCVFVCMLYVCCVCVCVALVIQHAKRIRRIVLSNVAFPAVSYFPYCLKNGIIFERKKIEHKMRVLIFSTTCLKYFSFQRRNQRDTIVNVYRSLCTVPVLLVRFFWNLNFLYRFSKNRISNFIKICPVGAEFLADGLTDRYDEANSRFLQFCERVEKWVGLCRHFQYTF